MVSGLLFWCTLNRAAPRCRAGAAGGQMNKTYTAGGGTVRVGQSHDTWNASGTALPFSALLGDAHLVLFFMRAFW